MRYPRGYVALSDANDVPVLLHIRNARAIQFDQLQDLILFDGAGVAVNSLRWRVARLEKNGVIQRFQDVRYLGKPVYGITSAGLSFLESRGHILFSLPSTTERKIIHSLQIPHALELVNIRLAMLRAGILVAWKCDLEIASRNLVLDGPPAKDYDAIAEIEVDGVAYSVAIEYERSLKKIARYREIREILDQDQTAETILYLAVNEQLLCTLAYELRAVHKHIGFAISGSFRQSPLNTLMVINNAKNDTVSLRGFLAAEERHSARVF
jgi:DNA-binding Lrp family transcriptional regulator